LSSTDTAAGAGAVPAAEAVRARGIVERIATSPDATRYIAYAGVVIALVIGGVLRLSMINAFGYNSDEAVYAGQAAGIVGSPELQPYFPVFRAHPLLYQFVLALSFAGGVIDVMGRYLAVAIGLGTILLAYLTGSVLYGRMAGMLAAFFLALMPYHVVVTRQVLLDGPMAFCATLALYLMARHGFTQRAVWFYAAAGALGLAFQTKETAIVFVAAIYAYLALSPEIHVRIRDLIGAGLALVLIILPFPLSLFLAGGGGVSRTQQYLVWQLLRRPNHDLAFYPTMVPSAMGLLLVGVVLVGLVFVARRHTWRERLLLAWIVVPLTFFELWPTKGFQYPVVTAPAVAILGGSMLVKLAGWAGRSLGSLRISGRAISGVLAAAICVSLVVPSIQAVTPSSSGEFLAGSGGVPGGREAGTWISANVPPGGQILAIGPSMANIIQFYGHRKTYGLSVSTNPLNRNPSYEPIPNADLMIRSNTVQYIVWDSYSASRSTYFSDSVMAFVDRYHGREVHRQSVQIADATGTLVEQPVIIVYEVRP
jgi:hypothetical protein